MMKPQKSMWLALVMVAVTCTAGAQTSESGTGAPTQAGSSQTAPAAAPAAPGTSPDAAPSEVQPAQEGQPSTAPSNEMIPDQTPLNSPQELTLGTSRESSGRSYLIPSFRFSQTISKTVDIPGLGTEAISNMAASAQWLHSWAHSHFDLHYTAGGNLYSDRTQLNSAYQQYGLVLGFDRTRWQFTLRDDGSYLPESSFGFYGTQFLGSGSGLGAGYVPNQTILTEGTRLSNTVTGTTNYQVSARSSIHFSGAWGILRSQGGARGQNNDHLNFGGGLDHNLGGGNTIGVAYMASLYSFGGSDREVLTHSVHLAYGRRITGKLAMQLSGGPQVRLIDDPSFGTDTAVTWSVRAGLVYEMGRTELSTSFARGTSGGAGVLGGATTTNWTASIGRGIARQWSVNGNFGVARNSSLMGDSLERTFNSQFAGVQVSRVLGREWTAFLRYNFQHQTSNVPVCLGCGDSFDRHIFGIGFEWHGRPMTGWF